jgi:probable F420-dependent oxidoreductase
VTTDPDRIGFEITDVGSIAERVELATWAEERGFDDAWTAEITDPDAFVILTAVALATSRMRLGTAIVPIGARSGAHLGAAAASLEQLAPGRTALGIGVSSEVIVEQWNGVPYPRPLERARETIEVLRAVLAGERTDHAGKQIRSTGFKLRHPPASPPPIVLAALNNNMLELAGELADGVYLNFVPPEAVPMAVEAVQRGVKRAGRTDLPEIILGIPCAVTDDPDTARAEFGRALAFYLTAPPYQRALEWYGFEDEVARARAAWADRDLEAVRAVISRRLIDGIGAFGSAEYCRDRVAAFVESGVTTVSISPTQQDLRATLQHFVR